MTVQAKNLTEAQADGLACVECGNDWEDGTRSAPVALVNGVQVFACVTHECPDCKTCEYEYLPNDNDDRRLFCKRDHMFPTQEPFFS